MYIWIPEEIWCMIFEYMDTESFYNTIEALKSIYPDLAHKLMLTICLRAIKNNYRVKLMNYLYLDIDFFRKPGNYLMYINIFKNSFFFEEHKPYNHKEATYKTGIARNYKEFILNKLEEEGNSNKKKIFNNLTKLDSVEGYFTKKELKECVIFRYRNITINLIDIFNYTHNQSRMGYQQLVQLQSQLNYKPGSYRNRNPVSLRL